MPMFGRPSQRDQARELAYRQWFSRQHVLALPAIILSAFSLTHFGTLWIDEIIGVTLGIVTLVQLSRVRGGLGRGGRGDGRGRGEDNRRTEGDWMAWAAIVVGLISFSLAVFIQFVLPARR